MLLGEQRRRHQHSHLMAGLHGHERRAQRDFGLAEAHVAADHAVHRLRAAPVLEHAVDGGLLVFGFLEWELQREPLIARLVELERTGEGVYRTAEPVPVHGDWKTMVRLHSGSAIRQNMPQ